jgi:hypothetical protein
MTTMDQVKADLDAAATYVRVLEHKTGKRTTKQLRQLLENAFMAGVKHGRETGSATPATDTLADLLGRKTL